MAWIELHQTVTTNHKVLKLRQLLRLRPSQAVGHLCFLWLWALDNSRGGELTGVPADVIAQAADFNVRRADEFIEALVEAGLLDREGESLRIHDWDEYAGRLQLIRERSAERKRRYRDKLRDGDGTGTSADVPRIHNRTGEDPTQPDQTQPDRTGVSSGAADGSLSVSENAQTRAESSGELLTELLGEDYACGLLAPIYTNAKADERRRSDALCDELFRAYCTRPPTGDDRARVFQSVSHYRRGEGYHYDAAKAGLLAYAFEQAVGAGCAGVWSYIDGVLHRLRLRDLRDREAAEDYDSERAAR